MYDRTHNSLMPLVLLAAASGARTWSGVAAISKRTPPRVFTGVELAFDKMPTVPSRLAPPLLIGRIAAGAVIGALVGRRAGRRRAEFAILGGLIAFASAHATYRMRRALSKRLPAISAALVEDAIVLGAAAAGAALLRGDVGRD
jgi:uncharacterized membrane protein